MELIKRAGEQSKERSINMHGEQHVIEHFDKYALESYNTHVHVAAHAHVSHVVLYDDSAPKSFKEERIVHVGADARVTAYYIVLGSTDIALDIQYQIDERAHVDHKFVFVGHKAQRAHIDEKFICIGESARGNFLAETLLTDNAFCNYIGNIIIKHSAPHADTRLDVKSYLLSETAKSSMVPSMQVETNDVRAGHGGSIAQLSPDDLFYLRSRGVTKEQAYKLVVNGILTKYIEAINDASLEKHVLDVVNKRI